LTPREEQDRARTQADLERLARLRGYSNPKWWAMQVLAARAKKQTKAVTFKGVRV
jgi:hypothetical protein